MPTPAPDRATLHNVEDAVNAALKAMLEAASIGAVFTFPVSQLGNLPDSRTEVWVRVGSNIGEREYAWQAEIVARVFTDRSVDSSGTAGQRAGAIRSVLRRVPPGEDWHPDFTEELLPYHVINRLAHATTDCGADADGDLRELHYDAVISVRPGCFPVEFATYLRPDGSFIFRPDGSSVYTRP